MVRYRARDLNPPRVARRDPHEPRARRSDSSRGGRVFIPVGLMVMAVASDRGDMGHQPPYGPDATTHPLDENGGKMIHCYHNE